MARRRVVRYQNENQLAFDFNTTEEIVASINAEAQETPSAGAETAAANRSAQIAEQFRAMFKVYEPTEQERASEKRFDPTINAAIDSLPTILEFISDYREKPVGFPTAKEKILKKGLSSPDLTMENVATYLEMLNAAKSIDQGQPYHFNSAAVPTFRVVMNDSSPLAAIYPAYINSKSHLEHLDKTVTEIADFARSNVALAASLDRDAQAVLETCNIDQRFIEECNFIQKDILRVWNAYERNISMQIDLAAGTDQHVEPEELFDDVPLPDLTENNLSSADIQDPSVLHAAQLIAQYYNDNTSQNTSDVEPHKPADHLKTAEKLVKAIVDVDVPLLIDTYASEGRSLFGVEGGAYAFGKITGYELKGDALNRQSAIYDFAQFTPEQIADDQQRIQNHRAAMQAQADQDKLSRATAIANLVVIHLEPKLSNQPWYEALYAQKQDVDHRCSGKEWVDTLVQNGYHHLRSQKVGGIDKTYLANDVNDAYLLNHEDLREYALTEASYALQTLAQKTQQSPEELVHQGDYLADDDVFSDIPVPDLAAAEPDPNVLSANYQATDEVQSPTETTDNNQAQIAADDENFDAVPVPSSIGEQQSAIDNAQPHVAEPAAADVEPAAPVPVQESTAGEYTYLQLEKFSDDQRFDYANALYDQMHEVKGNPTAEALLTERVQMFAKHVPAKDHLAEAYLSPIANAMHFNVQYQEEFGQHVRKSAVLLKDMAWSLGAHDGITDDVLDQLLADNHNFAKSQRDTILMDKFGISRVDAHAINNGLDEHAPSKITSAEIEACLDEFPAVREIIETAKRKVAEKQNQSSIQNDPAAPAEPTQSAVTQNAPLDIKIPAARQTNRVYAEMGEGQQAQQKIISGLNKKAASYGLPPVKVLATGTQQYVAVNRPVFVKGEEIGSETTLRPYREGESLSINDRVVELAYVDIEYDVIKKEGFTVTAQISIDDAGTPAIIQMAEPKVAKDEDYTAYLMDLVQHSHEANMPCDHCETDRARKTVYALEADDGSFKTIGSTCVEDYIGLDPSKLANLAKFYNFISYQNLDEYGELGTLFAGKASIAYNTVDVVTAAVAVIDQEGRYVSAKQAEENMTFSTRDLVQQMLHTSLDKLQGAPEFESARTRAQSAIEFAKKMPPENTFAINLSSAANASIALEDNKMTMGLLASLPTTYERAIRNSNEASVSVHVGKKGEKLESHGMQIQTAIQMDGEFGLKNMFVFKDDNANVFKWTSTGRDPLVYSVVETIQQLRKIASPVKIEIQTSASIKDHQTYQGIAQTVLQRAKFGSVTNPHEIAGALLSSPVGKADELVADLIENKGVDASEYPKLYQLAIDHVRKDNPVDCEKLIAELSDARNPALIGLLSEQSNQIFEEMPSESRTAALLASNIKRLAAEHKVSLGIEIQQDTPQPDAVKPKTKSVQNTLDAAFDC